MFSINFYCREVKKSRNGESPLELAVNVNGKRKIAALPFKCRPEDFKKKRQPQEIKDYIEEIRRKVRECQVEFVREDMALTPDNVIDYVRNGGIKSVSAMDVVNEYLGILKARVGTSLTASVYRKYELVANLFGEVADMSKDSESAFSLANILIYKAKIEKKYQNQTAVGYLTKMKTIITYAIDSGYLKNNPFNGIKIRREEKDIIYLNESEIEALKAAEIDNESLDRVRDRAIFQISTGMAFSDMCDFKMEDIQTDENGINYITKKRNKTGKVFTAVVLPEGLEVLKKYNGNIPQISNQKQNYMLKLLGQACGIKTSMTTHVFRRTYATLLLNRGIRIETVAESLGDSLKITQRHYAKLQKQTVIKEIGKVFYPAAL